MWTQLKVNDFFKKQTAAPPYFMQEQRKPLEYAISKDMTKESIAGQARKVKAKKEEKYKDDEFLYKLMP